jgi:hypothetical protein
MAHELFQTKLGGFESDYMNCARHGAMEFYDLIEAGGDDGQNIWRSTLKPKANGSTTKSRMEQGR